MTNANAIISDFKGVYARVARKLDVSASMVSRVARGERRSPQIERALLEELSILKQKLESYSAAAPEVLHFPQDRHTTNAPATSRGKNFPELRRNFRSASR
jgi:transcriptional regulator with XRE-family HTH domain